MTDMPWLDWYQSLAKPSWTPAPGTIGLIWQVLDWQALVGSLFVGTGPEFTARAHSLARVGTPPKNRPGCGPGGMPLPAAARRNMPNAEADGVGFEPTSRFRDCRFSRPVHSTALPPVRRDRYRGPWTRSLHEPGAPFDSRAGFF
jgi:hypothetical protein